MAFDLVVKTSNAGSIVPQHAVDFSGEETKRNQRGKRNEWYLETAKAKSEFKIYIVYCAAAIVK